MLILTDFPSFPKQWKTTNLINGETSAALASASPWDLLRLIPEIRRSDLVLIHESGTKVLWLVLLFWIVPFLKKPIVSVDIILRKPYTGKERITARIKKILLKRVDHFIHYFKDLNGYENIYGISPAKSSYVPFKANIFGDSRLSRQKADKEEYVFAAGWSLRDYDTFFAAVAQLGYPAAIAQPDFEKLKQHGARFTWKMENLPKNLVILDDDGTPDALIKNFSRARIFVIPILRDSLRAAGISIYLDAMLLKKCVVISSGPGVTELLTNQAIIVPPEDPNALAQAIKKVWENSALREEVALRGYHYSASLRGERELMDRILDEVISWHRSTIER